LDDDNNQVAIAEFDLREQPANSDMFLFYIYIGIATMFSYSRKLKEMLLKQHIRIKLINDVLPPFFFI